MPRVKGEKAQTTMALIGISGGDPHGASTSIATIPGLSLVTAFIDEDKETDALTFVDSREWSCGMARRVQHYGWRYDYKARAVGPDMYLGPLPAMMSTLARKLVENGMFKSEPDQVIVNEYLPGQGIAPHIDCEPCFGDTIVSLSLGSGCVMIFQSGDCGQTAELYLPRRSALVLRNDARYRWRHSIRKRKVDVIHGVRWTRERRVSLTFRTVLKP